MNNLPLEKIPDNLENEPAAIGKPKRQVRKVSHCSSNQQ